jgi:hypothetical protein
MMMDVDQVAKVMKDGAAIVWLISPETASASSVAYGLDRRYFTVAAAVTASL